MPSAAKLLQDARKHHQAGRLIEAEAGYRRILVTQPGHADALHLLGVIAHQGGQHKLAVELIRQVQQNGQNADYFSTLDVAVYDQGKLDEAVAAYRQAILIKPDYADAHSNLGNALREQGQLDEAIAALHQAIRRGVSPGYPDLNPIMLKPILTAALRCTIKASLTKPSPHMARPSGSNPIVPKPIPTSARRC